MYRAREVCAAIKRFYTIRCWYSVHGQYCAAHVPLSAPAIEVRAGVLCLHTCRFWYAVSAWKTHETHTTLSRLDASEKHHCTQWDPDPTIPGAWLMTVAIVHGFRLGHPL